MSYRILNSEEVAQYLNLTRADLQRLIKNREIPFEMRGGRAVFSGAEIDAWASQRILGFSASRLEEYQRKWAQSPDAVLSREAFVSELLPPSHIDAGIAAKTKGSILREMAALADRTGLLYDPAELIASLEAREALCSTALPGGIAFLHPRALKPYRFDASFLVLGRTLEPIHFGSPDQQPTDLFFLICCQEDRLHLHTLARLCLMAQKTDLLVELRAASDASAMHQCILDSEQKALGTSRPAAENS